LSQRGDRIWDHRSELNATGFQPLEAESALTIESYSYYLNEHN
jgi:hypothetical protein